MSYTNPAKPGTARDKALSMKHLKDSVKFNEAHAKDHLNEVKAVKKEIKARVKIAKKGY